ncbi:DUF3667 domain-containing protein [Maribellus sediminis]|uniref:DUF3667 domain-containing protein n=1 Tax=Maribellus sediminis TaxID=2696285 RepID=UPI00142FB8B3|nr:DUF3667 domain-containing protein [Maribellus sediminis]
MLDRSAIEHCPNCNSTHIDNYCLKCGQKIYQKRFTTKGFFEVIGNALNIERGFLYTVVWLFRNPGKVVGDYLKGKTKIYINPLNYILIIAGAYAFLVLSLNILDSSLATTNSILQNDGAQPSAEVMEMQLRWIEFVKKYMNFIPILMIPFASLISKWYYNKRKLFYGEHLIINTFIFAQSILISVLFSPVLMMFPVILKIYPIINFSFTIIYFTFAFFLIYQKSVITSFFGALIIYVGGMILFFLFIMAILIVVVVVLKVLGVNLLNIS